MATPFSHRAADLARIEATELPFLSQVDLRAPSADLPFAAPEPNRVGAWGKREVLWLGPDEWLVVAEPDAAAAIVEELDSALQGVHHSAVDVSANRVVFELPEPSARELLSRGCGLDLHPRSWKPGMCAQTLVAGTQVILQEREESTRIFVRPSFASHLLDWFASAET